MKKINKKNLTKMVLSFALAGVTYITAGNAVIENVVEINNQKAELHDIIYTHSLSDTYTEYFTNKRIELNEQYQNYEISSLTLLERLANASGYAGFKESYLQNATVEEVADYEDLNSHINEDILQFIGWLSGGLVIGTSFLGAGIYAGQELLDEYCIKYPEEAKMHDNIKNAREGNSEECNKIAISQSDSEEESENIIGN